METTTQPGTPESASYAPTDRTVPTRSRDRATYDRAAVHAILDASYVCHLGFVRDGAPIVLPTLYGRVGERLYVHGSTGSRPLRMAGAAPEGTAPEGAASESGPSEGGASEGVASEGASDPGLPVCLTVTHVDGLVLARSAFHHSINYRSVMVHGIARQVTDPDEKRTALDALVDHVVPGRSADSRRANAKELAATAVLSLDLDEVSAKMRTGGPDDEPEDMDLPHWSGVVPLRKGYDPLIPSADLAPGIEVPDYLTQV
ncbi:pyridoxamine 5'-phosphate oxidase family protein [Streptomyces aureocirculatus]|uniref:pyridoxamine 5'-phosphate oxidase family protein n=1 Tax=Streptomyces aureocirculatus TaxID=67275 RepID=UPI0004CA6D23|nr:pyridoxamine 5'-phosphate oxidase family protein [Streptomyces aureocirculatus]